MLYIPLLIGNMQRAYLREFPGGPVVSRQAFTAVGPGSIPGWGTKIPQAKKKKKKGGSLLKNNDHETISYSSKKDKSIT